MAFWNFTHGVLHMHVWLLPAIVVGIIMLVVGLVHRENQKNREEDYNKELRGEIPEAAPAGEEVSV